MPGVVGAASAYQWYEQSVTNKIDKPSRRMANEPRPMIAKAVPAEEGETLMEKIDRMEHALQQVSRSCAANSQVEKGSTDSLRPAGIGGRSRRPFVCWVCAKPGHSHLQCQDNKDHSYVLTEEQERRVALAQERNKGRNIPGRRNGYSKPDTTPSSKTNGNALNH